MNPFAQGLFPSRTQLAMQHAVSVGARQQNGGACPSGYEVCGSSASGDPPICCKKPSNCWLNEDGSYLNCMGDDGLIIQIPTGFAPPGTRPVAAPTAGPQPAGGCPPERQCSLPGVCCPEHTRCNNNVCYPVPGVGSCDDSSDCYGGQFCRAGTCQDSWKIAASPGTQPGRPRPRPRPVAQPHPQAPQQPRRPSPVPRPSSAPRPSSVPRPTPAVASAAAVRLANRAFRYL